MMTRIEPVSGAAGEERPAAIVEEQLYCALSGRPISHDQAYWAPPLVSARQLVTTVLGALLRAPANLGPLLFDEQPNVPYAADVRDQLAARRSAEQFKLLVGLLALVALVALPLIWLSMR